MEENNLEQEIAELEKELKELKEEQKIINSFIKKGMNNDRYKELMVQKKELENFINEVEMELALLKNEIENTDKLSREELESLYDITGYNEDWVKIREDIESGVLKPKDNLEDNQ